MASLAEAAYKEHPVDVKHKHPDLNSLKEIPESYTWRNEDDETLESNHNESVPVIDMNDPNASKLIGHACMSWGVFQVVNHGIATTLFDHIEGLGETLFSLPSHQKQKAARSPHGMAGYGIARSSPFFPKLMWSEGFTVLGSPLHHFSQLWPHQHDHNKHCDDVMEYDEAMKELAGKMMWIMLNYLGITKEELKWAGSDSMKKVNIPLQLNFYPTCPDPDRAMGLAIHTDSNLLSIVYQNNVSGLQVHREGAGWVRVEALPGGLVINVGDLLHILSNGLYPSVIHRVMVNPIQKRLSVAYLYGPPLNVEISPHHKLVGPNSPPLYKPVTWSQYLTIKATHFNKSLSIIRNSTSP